MAEIIVKQSREKTDPRHPESTDPTYAAAAKKGRERMKKLKFESKGERRDYERTVKSNPGNVMGMPTFFPPLTLRSFVSMPEVSEEDRRQRALDRYRENLIRDMELFCWACDRVTVFQHPSYRCKTCGNKFRMPIINAPQGQEKVV